MGLEGLSFDYFLAVAEGEGRSGNWFEMTKYFDLISST